MYNGYHSRVMLCISDLPMQLGHLTHLCRMYIPILFNWISPFPILGLLGGVFNFYSSFKRSIRKQNMENHIRRHILGHLIWFYTVYQCPTKITLGLYALIKLVFWSSLQLRAMHHWSAIGKLVELIIWVTFKGKAFLISPCNRQINKQFLGKKCYKWNML